MAILHTETGRTLHKENDPRYAWEWWMVRQIFRDFERDERYLIPAFFIKNAKESETKLFLETLTNLVVPDKIRSHSFRLLDETIIYGYGKDGTENVMADVAVCDTVTAERRENGVVYQKEFYLFYHVHFTEENGMKFEFIGSPLVRANCAHH